MFEPLLYSASDDPVIRLLLATDQQESMTVYTDSFRTHELVKHMIYSSWVRRPQRGTV
jgi:hypothetical protein